MPPRSMLLDRFRLGLVPATRPFPAFLDRLLKLLPSLDGPEAAGTRGARYLQCWHHQSKVCRPDTTKYHQIQPSRTEQDFQVLGQKPVSLPACRAIGDCTLRRTDVLDKRQAATQAARASTSQPIVICAEASPNFR